MAETTTVNPAWEAKTINHNLSVRLAVKPADITWYKTICPGIWYGCLESDSAIWDSPLTQITRFDPGGFFYEHGHPDGEEILVLQGSFQDETGEYSPGSYQLNPEGFVHVPSSLEGCLTFVKLRQHGGDGRQAVKININDLSWQPTSIPQIKVKPLYQQEGFPDEVWIEQWEPGTTLPQVIEPKIREIFVLQGVWADELGEYPAGTWLRYPANCPYIPSSPTGCEVYVKTYAFRHLK
ncbi:cupin domain-containing protein [Aerosakkonema funiforme]|uniref:Cupin domain-containing protein n=1 Tax=Aerosakkonema funiforme FACHB-1375 TaxID=2949571 RepID=A0A926VM57_9CYAN|nr:cupin domain-containing protein [Aerosakkonema funiforme]MBD2186330.1 cupin domain-containing protein [Aerosakkonema funiforme FACHB-1375]